VPGLVHEQELAGRGRGDLDAAVVDERMVPHELLARTEARVGQDRPGQVVAGHQPAPVAVGEVQAADRPVLARPDQLLGRVEGTAVPALGRHGGDGVRERVHVHSSSRDSTLLRMPESYVAFIGSSIVENVSSHVSGGKLMQ
jgi:hypothetical protein